MIVSSVEHGLVHIRRIADRGEGAERVEREARIERVPHAQDLDGCQQAGTRDVTRHGFLLETACLLLSPVVPHISSVLWQELGHSSDIIDAAWPVADEAAMVQDEIQYIVQVNGKLRDRLQIAADADQQTIEQLAQDSEGVQRHIEGKTVRKIIVVPGRLVNIVVG